MVLCYRNVDFVCEVEEGNLQTTCEENENDQSSTVHVEFTIYVTRLQNRFPMDCPESSWDNDICQRMRMIEILRVSVE